MKNVFFWFNSLDPVAVYATGFFVLLPKSCIFFVTAPIFYTIILMIHFKTGLVLKMGYPPIVAEQFGFALIMQNNTRAMPVQSGFGCLAGRVWPACH